MGMQMPQMPQPPEPVYHSADMVRELIDESVHWPRYETVYGELLVTPAPRPRHQQLAFLLARRLAEYLDHEPVGEVLLSPADISWGLADVLVQPDVFVVPAGMLRGTDSQWTAVSHLLLAAEVLSPGSGRADRFTKRRLYQERGVALYWLVDVDAQAVEVWTPETIFPHVERRTLVSHPAGASAPFSLELEELFASV